MVLTSHDSKDALIFRMANKRRGIIKEIEVQVFALVRRTMANGKRKKGGSGAEVFLIFFFFLFFFRSELGVDDFSSACQVNSSVNGSLSVDCHSLY